MLNISGLLLNGEISHTGSSGMQKKYGYQGKILKILIFIFAALNFSFSQARLICDDMFDNDSYDFSDGLAAFKLDNKWGFIDTLGNVVIPPIYKVSAWGTPTFVNGLCAVMNKDGVFGYINAKGDTVIPFKIVKPATFYENIAIFYFPGSAANAAIKARWSLLNKKGELILNNTPNDFSYNTEVKEGRARYSKNFKYGFIDTTGKEIIKNIYEDVRDFSNGLASAKLNGKWGFIDTLGSTIIDFQFANEPMPFSEDRTFIPGTNGKWALIDKGFKLFSEPVYDKVYSFSKGRAIVSMMENYKEIFSIINLSGKEVKTFLIPKNDKDKISLLTGFNEGLAVAQRGWGNELGFINTDGKTVIDFKFSKLNPFTSGRAFAVQYDEKTNSTKKGFIDKKGNYVIILGKKMF